MIASSRFYSIISQFSLFFFSSTERVGVAGDERLNLVLEAKIRRREVDFRYLLVVFVVGLEWLKNMVCGVAVLMCCTKFDELLS